MSGAITSGDARDQFWRSFLLAVEAEPRSATQVRGASGLFHPATAVGVDDIRRRIVLISGDADPRSAAFAQHDIQSANPTYRVVVARPIAIDLSTVAMALTSFLGTDLIGSTEFAKFSAAIPHDATSLEALDPQAQILAGGMFAGLRGAMEVPVVSLFATLQEVLKQLSQLAVEAPTAATDEGSLKSFFRLTSLTDFDPAAVDREVGNCPFPLYELSKVDAEAFYDGRDIARVRDVLRRLQLFQYFYPAPDHLVLGMAENQSEHSKLAEALAQSPVVGHPLGQFELLGPNTRIQDVIADLQDRSLIVEGEVGLELSEQGRVARASVRFKPREGFLAKLSRILSIKIDASLTDLFK